MTMPVLTRRLLFVSFPLVMLAGCKNTPPTASDSSRARKTEVAQSKPQAAKDAKDDSAKEDVAASTAPGSNSADPAPNDDAKPVAEVKATAARPPWPQKMGEFGATSRDRIPLFPVALSGYRSDKGLDYAGKPYPIRGSIRLEDGNQWKGLKHFPKARSGCSFGVFMLRWRLSDPVIRVYSTIDNPSKSTANVATGSYGYMYGSVCDKPQFKFASATKPNWANRVDVFYEVKFWEATP